MTNVPNADNVAGLHDAELYLVKMDRENATIDLGFKCIDHSVCTISFGKIWNYRIENIITQNVVSRILVSNTLRGFGDDLEKTVRWAFSIGNTLFISDEYVKEYVQRINSGELLLVYLDPSWGAEVAVIAEVMTVSRVAPAKSDAS